MMRGKYWKVVISLCFTCPPSLACAHVFCLVFSLLPNNYYKAKGKIIDVFAIFRIIDFMKKKIKKTLSKAPKFWEMLWKFQYHFVCHKKNSTCFNMLKMKQRVMRAIFIKNISTWKLLYFYWDTCNNMLHDWLLLHVFKKEEK